MWSKETGWFRSCRAPPEYFSVCDLLNPRILTVGEGVGDSSSLISRFVIDGTKEGCLDTGMLPLEVDGMPPFEGLPLAGVPPLDGGMMVPFEGVPPREDGVMLPLELVLDLVDGVI